MPRPERIRQREAVVAGAVAQPEPEAREAVAPATERAPANDPVDRQRELLDTEANSAPEGDAELDISRKVARRLGWVPKEEWTRDPTKWTDAPDFLERTPAAVQSLRDRLNRTEAMIEADAEAARLRVAQDAEAKLRTAAKAGDEDAAVAASRELAKASQPHPQTAAWVARNSWFKGPHEDPLAQAVAVAAINRAARAGAAIDEQLQAGEAAARSRFPEHFRDTSTPAPQPTPAPAPTEVRLSDIRTAPALAPGSRGGTQRTTAPKEKGWTDIPAADRTQMEKQAQRIAHRHRTSVADVMTRMAGTYWQEQG